MKEQHELDRRIAALPIEDKNFLLDLLVRRNDSLKNDSSDYFVIREEYDRPCYHCYGCKEHKEYLEESGIDISDGHCLDSEKALEC